MTWLAFLLAGGFLAAMAWLLWVDIASAYEDAQHEELVDLLWDDSDLRDAEA